MSNLDFIKNHLQFLIFYDIINHYKDIPYNDNAPVAQLDRASDSDSEGRAFESH